MAPDPILPRWLGTPRTSPRPRRRWLVYRPCRSPSGWETASLPVGAQIIARRGGDVDALAFAAALEEAVWAAGSKGGGAGPWGDFAAGVLGWGPDHAALAVDDAARFGGGAGGEF